jgi:hypothetical protein
MKEKLIYVKQNWMNEPSLVAFISAYIYTVVLIIMIIADYLTKDFRTPDSLIQIYQWLLIIYVTFKASDRWILKINWKSRGGEVLVIAWLVTAITMYIVEYCTKGFYSTPPAIINITKDVLIIFAFSRAFKYLYKKTQREKNKYPPPVCNTSLEECGPSRLIIEN